MTKIKDIQRDLFTMMEKEIKDKKYDKAIEIAISCYFLSKGRGLEEEEFATGQIYVAFSALFQKDAKGPEPACSFCGRTGKNVRLGAGPEAFICDKCVEIFAEQFNTNPTG